MLKPTTRICPYCGGRLIKYGHVKRIVRSKNGARRWIKLQRVCCVKCLHIHRVLPSFIFPFKHYTAQIIKGFVDGTFSSLDLYFEDYPCESTIRYWKKHQPTFAQTNDISNLE